MRTIYWRSLLTAGACLLLLAHTSCGKHEPGLSTPSVLPLSSAPAPDLSLDAQAPPGVDPAVWGRLLTALRSAVAQQGKSAPAAVPVAEDSRVDDFIAVPDAAGVAYASWTYCDPGDYSQNGSVGADDLVPLAVYYELDSASPDWAKASVADGNGDGRIDAGDIVLIAQKFGNAVGGYMVQQGASPDEAAAWAGMLNVPVGLSTLRAIDGRREFRPSLTAARAGGYFRVQPYLALPGGDASFGLPSNACRYYGGAAGPGAWPMPGGNPQHSSYSPGPGPAQLRLRWLLDAADYGGDGWTKGPILGRDGAVYLAQHSGLQALNPDGTLRWRWDYQRQEDQCLALSADGTLYVLSEPLGTGYHLCTLSALGNDGKLKWQVQVSGTEGHMVVDGERVYVNTTAENACYDAAGNKLWSQAIDISDPGPVAIDQQGNAYFCNELELAKYTPGGGRDWSYFLPGPVTAALTIRPDGIVLAPTACGLYAYSSTGQELWHVDALTNQVKALAVADNNVTVFIADPEATPSGRMVLAVLDSSGELQHQAELSYPAFDPFLTLDSANKIYLYGDNVGLHCLTTDAVELWSYYLPSGNGGTEAELGCAIGADGALYVAGYDYVFCLADDGYSTPVAPAVTASDAQFIDHVQLSWSAVPGAGYYRVYRDNLTAPLLELTGTEYDDYSALGTAYHSYAVCAFNIMGKGAPSKRAMGRLRPSSLANLGPGDWATFGHDARRTFCSSASGPMQGRVLWTHANPDLLYSYGYAPVFGADGTLYVAYSEGRLEALTPDGAVLWRLDIPGTLSRPVLGPDGTLYFGTAPPPDSGGGPPPPPPPPPPFTEEPYKLETAAIHALASNRKQRWQFEIAADLDTWLPGITVGNDGRVYASASDTWLLALSPGGQLLASYVLPDAADFDHSISIGPDSNLYVMERTNIDRPRLLMLDPMLHYLWHYTWYGEYARGYSVQGPAVAPDGTLYIAGAQTITGTPGGGFSMLNPSSRCNRPALAASGRLYVANDLEHPVNSPRGLGYFEHGVFIELDQVQHALTSNILLDATGKVYFTAYAATTGCGAYCFDASDNLLWTLDLPGAGYDPDLSMGNDGTLYAISGTTLWAVGER
jgi:hypothetical protein